MWPPVSFLWVFFYIRRANAKWEEIGNWWVLWIFSPKESFHHFGFKQLVFKKILFQIHPFPFHCLEKRNWFYFTHSLIFLSRPSGSSNSKVSLERKVALSSIWKDFFPKSYDMRWWSEEILRRQFLTSSNFMEIWCTFPGFTNTSRSPLNFFFNLSISWPHSFSINEASNPTVGKQATKGITSIQNDFNTF